MAFRCPADIGPLLTVFGSSLPQKKPKKTLAELDPLWQKLSGSAQFDCLCAIFNDTISCLSIYRVFIASKSLTNRKTYICCPLCQLPETDKSTVYMPFGSFQFLLSSADICFKISFKYISECRTVWIHIDPGVLSGLVQPFCKDFQQMTKIVSSGLFKS